MSFCRWFQLVIACHTCHHLYPLTLNTCKPTFQYRVTLVVEYLGWVDLNVESSSIRWLNTQSIVKDAYQILVNPTMVFVHGITPLPWGFLQQEPTVLMKPNNARMMPMITLIFITFLTCIIMADTSHFALCLSSLVLTSIH